MLTLSNITRKVTLRQNTLWECLSKWNSSDCIQAYRQQHFRPSKLLNLFQKLPALRPTLLFILPEGLSAPCGVLWDLETQQSRSPPVLLPCPDLDHRTPSSCLLLTRSADTRKTKQPAQSQEWQRCRARKPFASESQNSTVVLRVSRTRKLLSRCVSYPNWNYMINLLILIKNLFKAVGKNKKHFKKCHSLHSLVTHYRTSDTWDCVRVRDANEAHVMTLRSARGRSKIIVTDSTRVGTEPVNLLVSYFTGLGLRSSNTYKVTGPHIRQ